jgi:WD40 repeat protein
MTLARIAAPLALAVAMAVPSAGIPAPADVIRFSTTITIGSLGDTPLALSRERGLLATTDVTRVRIFALGPLDGGPPRELTSLPSPKWTTQLAFSPDGASLAAAGNGATVWSTQGWRPRWTLPASESLSALAYSPDGRTLYLAGSSAFIEALDAAAGTVRWKQPALATGTSNVAISPGGKVAAVGSYGGGLRLVSTTDGATIAALADTSGHGGKTTAAQRAGWLAHPGGIQALAFSSDGARLASAGGDGTIKLWDVPKQSVIWTNVCGWSTAALAFERNGRTLDAGCGDTIRRLNVRNGKIAATLRGHGGGVGAVALESDGRGLWSAGETLKRWDLQKGEAVATYGAIDAAALSADGKTLAFARGDDAIVLRDMNDGRTLAILRGHVLPNTLGSYSYSREAVAISRDGAYVAAGGYVTEGFIDHSGVAKAVTRLWRRTGAQPLRVWNDVAPDAMAFSQNEGQLVVRSPAMSDTPDTVWTASVGSGALKAWVAQWKLYVDKDSYWPCSPDGFSDAAITFAGGAPSLVVASGDCKKQRTNDNAPLRLWPVGERTPGAPFSGGSVNPNGALALSADGTTAVTLDANQFAVWDVARRALRGSGAGSALIDYSPRLEKLVVGGPYAIALLLADPSRKGNWNRYSLVVWDLRSAKRVATTESRGAGEHSRLLVRADGTQAYVTTLAGIDVWVLKSAR